MPLKRGMGIGGGPAPSPATTAVSVSVAVGIGVAAVAGLAAGAAIGTGVLAVGAASVRRGAKPAATAQDVEYDAEGRITNWAHLLKIVQQGGVAPELRAELWPFLLGIFSPDSTAEQRTAELTRLRNLYTKLVLVCQELDQQIEAFKSGASSRPGSATPPSGSSPTKPPQLSNNLVAFAEAHRIIVMDAVRTDMRLDISNFPSSTNGGRSTGPPAAMPTVTVLPVSVSDGLPELMLVDPPAPGPAEAVANGQVPLWRSALATSTIEGASHATPAARRLMMRLVNVLSTYAVHDPETAYCQGMSDLACVFVQLSSDDALAFACFERLMRGARQNFRHDETGIKSQLVRVARLLADTDPALHAKLEALGAGNCTFAYRMVLVMLRRELPLHEALTLWEIKWALEAATEAEARGAVGQPAGTLASSGSGGVATGAATGTLSPVGSFSSSHSSALAATVSSMDAAAKAAVAAAGGGANGGVAGVKGSGRGGAVSKHSRKPPAGSSRQPPPPPPDFVLQFVVAVVRSQRGRVLMECRDTDDVLRLFNAVKIDFWAALAQARKQHKAYAQGITVLKRLQ